MSAGQLSTYKNSLNEAMAALKRGDKSACMFLLQSALKLANKAKGDPRHRKAIFKAMNHVRAIPTL